MAAGAIVVAAVVRGDGLDQVVGELPLLAQPRGHLRVIPAEGRLLECHQRQSALEVRVEERPLATGQPQPLDPALLVVDPQHLPRHGGAQRIPTIGGTVLAGVGGIMLISSFFIRRAMLPRVTSAQLPDEQAVAAKYKTATMLASSTTDSVKAWRTRWAVSEPTLWAIIR